MKRNNHNILKPQNISAICCSKTDTKYLISSCLFIQNKSQELSNLSQLKGIVQKKFESFAFFWRFRCAKKVPEILSLVKYKSKNNQQ